MTPETLNVNYRIMRDALNSIMSAMSLDDPNKAHTTTEKLMYNVARKAVEDIKTTEGGVDDRSPLVQWPIKI